MAVQLAHPNPLIQALQLAGADWVWPGNTLSLFWRTTAETMQKAGWPGYSNPWQWSDVRAAHLRRLGAPSLLDSTNEFRLESCMAIWLRHDEELQQHFGARDALTKVYLPRLDAARTDEESALLWAAMLEFEIMHGDSPVEEVLATWRASSPNSMRWVQAYHIVRPFGLDFWQTAGHMHRIVNGTVIVGECLSLDGLLV